MLDLSSRTLVRPLISASPSLLFQLQSAGWFWPRAAPTDDGCLAGRPRLGALQGALEMFRCQVSWSTRSLLLPRFSRTLPRLRRTVPVRLERRAQDPRAPPALGAPD